MAVGPGEREVARAGDVLDSVLHHEPEVDAILLVDDAPHERDLAAELGPGRRSIAVTPNPRDGAGHGLWGGLAAGMLHGYGWLHREVAPDVVLKLDTDALVIAPFAERVAAVLAEPSVGMAGTFSRHCDGRSRALDRWDFRVRRRRFPVRPFREGDAAEGRLRLRHTLWGAPAVLRRRIAAARRHGYGYGEHCLGGAYAVSGELLRRMNAAGYLDDPARWLSIDCPEDVMVGIYTRATGMTFRGFVGNNEAFGIRYKGLADSPEKLLDRGYSVIHSVKNDAKFTEEQIREFYQKARRHGST